MHTMSSDFQNFTSAAIPGKAPESYFAEPDAKAAEIARIEAYLQDLTTREAAATRREEALSEKLMEMESLNEATTRASQEETALKLAELRAVEKRIAVANETLQNTANGLYSIEKRSEELKAQETTTQQQLEDLRKLVASHYSHEQTLRSAINQKLQEQQALEAEIAMAKKTRTEAAAPAAAREVSPPSAADEEHLQEIIADLIRLVDQTDTAHSFAKKRITCEATRDQFLLLRKAMIAMLSRLKVAEVVVEPGTPVDRAMRGQLQVTRHHDGEGRPLIHTMLSSGFATVNATGQRIFLRKPEVITASETVLTAHS